MSDVPENAERRDDHLPELPVPVLVTRGAVGGVFMGLANLVPGISGGTMLLAAGIYPHFISAIADVTRLRLKFRSLLTLGVVVASALIAIVLLAGVVKGLVVDYRWAMYALFIGLTLGGVPVVWALIKTSTPGVWLGAAAGFIGMAALAYAQTQQVGGGGEAGWVMMIVAGIAGASAMILPGVSGAYLLLVLGVYLPILKAVDDSKAAASARDVGALSDPLIGVVIPVGIGVVIGVVVVSNGLKWLLDRYEKPTLGVLLGLLVGAVVGLWPFQRGVEPELGGMHRGRVIDEALLAELLVEPDKWRTEFFTPSAGQVIGAIGLIVLGFAITAAIAWFGKDRKKSAAASD